MLKLFLWLQYLRKRKIVYLSIAAVALSVSLLIVVVSLFTSFIGAFEQSAVDTVGDVVLSAPIKFEKYELFIERLEQIGTVKAATAILSAEGLLHLGKGNVRAVEILGIEAAKRAKVTGYKQFLLEQKLLPDDPTFEVPKLIDSIGGFVGIAVITEPDEKTDEYDFHSIEKMLGQQVVLTTGAVIEDKDTPAQSRFKRRTLKFTIADIVFTGVYDLDKRFVYLPIEHLQQILYPNENEKLADQIQIKLCPDADPEAALAQIRGVWQVFADEELKWTPGLIRYTDIQTAQQMQSKYVAALLKQMGVLLLVFGVVSFSVIVLIFCIFYMIVRLKQRDIAVLKSCGTASSSVAFIFVGFGIFTGLVGSGTGVVLGYIFTKNINTIEQWITKILGLKLWKSSVYMFSRIPNEVNWNSALPIVLSATLAAAIGALIPAIVAAMTRPVEILRYE
jgi:lipoprotein-releasing system permease protein